MTGVVGNSPSFVTIVDSLGIVGTERWFVGNMETGPKVGMRCDVIDLSVCARVGDVVVSFSDSLINDMDLSRHM